MSSHSQSEVVSHCSEAAVAYDNAATAAATSDYVKVRTKDYNQFYYYLRKHLDQQ